MNDLNNYLSSITTDFPAHANGEGGYFTFSNSGQRGGTKDFTLSLPSVITAISDIRDNYAAFNGHQHYIEGEWRDLGSTHFSDNSVNTLSTVQTKPLFTLLSKIVRWADGEASGEYVDGEFPMTIDKLNTTLTKLGVQIPWDGEPGLNLIIAGCPGVGKSRKAEEISAAGEIIRTIFHPEYTYSNFVGSYRPVVATRKDGDKVITADGEEIDEPVSYFEFVPGSFTRAILQAYEKPDGLVSLIIEEINRGDCAAIFGDMFQLLDRDATGKSEYGISVIPEMREYINKINTAILADDNKLYIPANLSLIATMNTSDQSLYPMDSAFKRRWNWDYLPIDFSHSNHVSFNDGYKDWNWNLVIELLNEAISESSHEDKRIGPWFIRIQDDQVSKTEFVSKLLFYLWHDVFRDIRTPIFNESLKTFDELQSAFSSGGLNSVLNGELVTKLEESIATEAPEVAEALPEAVAVDPNEN